jgi:3-oxoacyl-[acyl-carrier-protein] synthase-3
VTSIICGSGISIPDQLVTNDQLSQLMDTNDEWISTRSGVKERHFAAPGTGSSRLAVAAGQSALVDAGVDASQVDALVTATMTPDYYAPGIAGLVQHGLGLSEVASFDLRQQCSGFLYGLDLADSLIGSSRAETVLVIGAEVHSSFLPWGRMDADGAFPLPAEDQREVNNATRAWSVLFGDGAGAVVLRRGATEGEGVLASQLFTDGSQFELILVPGIGSRFQPYVDQSQLDRQLQMPVMDGAGLYRSAVRLMPEAVRRVCEKAGVEPAEVDLFVAHQANDRILEGVRRQLNVPAEKVPSNIARYGNTTSGTLPILFHELRQMGRVGPGTLICFTAFGAGAHWGALLYREPTGVAKP